VSSTQTVKIARIGPSDPGVHVIEVIDYHVNGWKRIRCLTHGLSDVISDKGDDVETATAAARECRRFRTMAFSPTVQPLSPSLPPEADR
jgi:hypothetical protein